MANAAALLAVARNAATGVGAPSYTSGVHIWNGPIASLNPNPAVARTTPTRTAIAPKGRPSATAGGLGAVVRIAGSK